MLVVALGAAPHEHRPAWSMHAPLRVAMGGRTVAADHARVELDAGVAVVARGDPAPAAAFAAADLGDRVADLRGAGRRPRRLFLLRLLAGQQEQEDRDPSHRLHLNLKSMPRRSGRHWFGAHTPLLDVTRTQAYAGDVQVLLLIPHG